MMYWPSLRFIALIAWELAGKRLELLKEMEPRTSHVAVFFDPLDKACGDSVVTFGWAMAEDLVARRDKGV